MASGNVFARVLYLRSLAIRRRTNIARLPLPDLETLQLGPEVQSRSHIDGMVTIRLIVQSINLVQGIIRHLFPVLTSPLMHLGRANCLMACRCKVLMEINNCILDIIRL
jgi:hypothetical protein